MSFQKAGNTWILCHQKESVLNIKCDQSLNMVEEVVHEFALSMKLFDIPDPYKQEKVGLIAKKSSGQSRSLPKPEVLAQDAVKVKALYESLKNDNSVTRLLPFGLATSGDSQDKPKAVEVAENFFRAVSNLEFKAFIECNDSSVGYRKLLFDNDGNFHSFLIPPESRIYCEDITDFGIHFSEPQFSLVVMDPPWRNKYIRRRKRKHLEAGYHMMYNNDIRDIPLEPVLKDKALVVVWCTNSKQHQREILDSFFPKWGLKFVAKWFWLKVTNKFVPVCPFNEDTKKQPFEVLMLGRRYNSSDEDSYQETLEDNGLIVSIPSAINSHKPPLLEVLKPFLVENDVSNNTCLELFARYALPGFTSYGNEAIKLMHDSLYHPTEGNQCRCLQGIENGAC